MTDLLNTARPYLTLCLTHDGDVIGECTCPDQDPRPLIAELQRRRAADRLRATAIGAVRRLAHNYPPVPPPLFRDPTSEHGVGFNHGARTLAQAVLQQLNDVLTPDGGELQ